MSRIHDKRGFNLTEAMIVIAVIGCIFACAVGMFNYSGFKSETLAAKQAKVEAALKTATMSIVGKDAQITVSQACDPVAMRNLYANRLTNATVIDNVVVNGKSLPALKVDGYGVMAFESSSNCENNWHAASSVTKTGTGSAKTPSASKTTTEATTNDATTANSPVVVYSVMEENASDIAVPANVTAQKTTSSNSTNSNSYTPNTMAFAVSSNGITNTYNSSASSTTVTATLPTVGNATTTSSSSSNNTIYTCAAGENYSHYSASCDVDVAFYQMFNGANCKMSFCPGNGYDNSGNLITSGQINTLCKFGEGNGNVGQCVCPEGKEYYVSRYLVDNSNINGICITSCAEFNMVDIGGNQCDCPSGAVWDATVQKCVIPGQCDRDYLKWDEYQVKCVCKTAVELVDMDPNYFGVCEIYDSTKVADGCKRLRDNWDKSTGTCVCPVPFTQNGVNCSCDSPRSMVNGECVCDSSKVSLAEDEIFVDNMYNPTCKEKCDTANYYFPNDDKTACVEKKPACGCLEILVNGQCVCNENITTEELALCADLDKENGYVFDATAPTCQSLCKGSSHPASSLKGCDCDCLKVYNGNECVCDPSQMNNDKCIGPDEVYDDTAPTCKICKDENKEHDVSGECVCKPADEITFAANEIYDPTAQNCKYTCKDGAVADATNSQCIGGCLEQYNYQTEKLECIPNPSDEITKACLANTNFVSDPSAIECKVECSTLTSPNDVHKACPCDATKVANALKQQDNLNKIYDLSNAPSCMMACQGQTIPSNDRTQCRPVDCLYETTDNITQHCIKNPSDEITKQCLANTNFVSDPTQLTCKKECNGLTGPDASHKYCPCDYDKVSTELNKSENLNKVYDLDNAPVCIQACTGQTIPSKDRLSCEQVPCLYETTDNVTMHCISNPTDEQAEACLAGTNYVSNPNALECKEQCDNRHTPNGVHKVCECDMDKMAGQYSSENMRFDSAYPNCESECPLNQIRDPKNPERCICKGPENIVFAANEIYYPTALTCKYVCKDGAIADAEHSRCIGGCMQEYNYETEKLQCIKNPSDEVTQECLKNTNRVFDGSELSCSVECPTITLANTVHKVCQCPATKPASLDIQAGYYYSSASTVFTGATACQLVCPTTGKEVTTWISNNIDSFTNPKMVYDSTACGCIGMCSGNYVASPDKTTCICGLNASSCAAGTYYDATTCTCATCPKGHYCPGNTDAPIACPCGTYGAVEGLTTPECSGKCQEGYYCPEASTSSTQATCSAGYTCEEGSCAPKACSFPFTSDVPYTACNECRTEAEIKVASPSYIGDNEVYTNDIALACKKCKSNMEYNSQWVCECPADKQYWYDEKCNQCQNWGTLYFARQEKNNASCTLYNHMNGLQKGGCFTDAARVPSDGMKKAAALLSNADKNRNFGNGVYAYMVAVSPDGKSASVVGVFTARSWYNIFPADYSSVSTAKSKQKAGSCQDMCAGNKECISTCDYLYGKIDKNSMFTSCKYAIKNEFYNQSFNNASDELCQGGQIVIKDSCTYDVGGLMRRVTSPLVLDLKGDGLEFTSVGDGVIFDLDNDGEVEYTAWTTAQAEFDNAFLVLDKNGNGQVDNGGELFGDQNGAENGFVELAKYDDNADKLITKDDAVFDKLLLWVDFNKNAKVDYDNAGNSVEIKTLQEAGVTELSTVYKKEVDANGNILKDIYGNITGFIGSFKMMVEDVAGKLVEVIRTMMDVFFVTNK